MAVSGATESQIVEALKKSRPFESNEGQRYFTFNFHEFDILPFKASKRNFINVRRMEIIEKKERRTAQMLLNAAKAWLIGQAKNQQIEAFEVQNRLTQKEK